MVKSRFKLILASSGRRLKMAQLERNLEAEPLGETDSQLSGPKADNLNIQVPASQPPAATAPQAEPPSTSPTISLSTAASQAKRTPSEDGKPRPKKRRAAAATTSYADVQDEELLKPSDIIQPIEAAQLNPIDAEQRHWNHEHVELHTFDGPVHVKMWTPGTSGCLTASALTP